MPYIKINDCRYYYEEFGSGKETILFSHGLLWDHTMFQSQIDHLKDRFRIIAYDHRGQGKSEVTNEGYGMDQLYKDVVELILQFKLGEVHFVGLSMGGFVGMRLASRNPELVKSLVLMDTSAQDEPNKLKYRMLATIVRFFGTKPVADKVMKIMFGQKALSDPNRTEQREKWRNSLLNLDKSIVKAVKGVIDRHGVEDELKNIQCPTLILVGTQDVATVPAKSQYMYQHIPNATLQYIEGAGHSSTVEEPESVNHLLEKFLVNEA